MLHSVIIIKKDSGICLFSEKYSIDFDSALYSGFLTAIQNFSENLNIGRLTSFITNDKIIILATKESVVVSLIVDLDDNANEWFDKAYLIAEKFEEKYQLEKWSGDISTFNNFSEDLQKLLKAKEKNFLIEVAKWAKKEFGGELHINPVLIPSEDFQKIKIDIMLDRGEIAPAKIHDKITLSKFQGLKRDLTFIKVVDGIVGRGEIKEFIENVKEFGQFDTDNINPNIFPYFPKTIVIIGKDFSDTVNDLTDKLYNVKNNRHFIQSKKLNLKILGPLSKLEIFNGWVEYWKWKEPYAERIFK